MKYNHKPIEGKWQKIWEDKGVFHAEDNSEKEKFYALIEFPYPSGQGLHVGHPRPYTALDTVARKRRLQGYNVLYPIGWDAFGLPTENYAIKNHIHPEIVTKQNIARFKKQIQSLGISFDWSREINTTDPDYYKWTQWAFQKMFQSFFCNSCQKAQPIEKLVARFEEKGTEGLNVAESEHLEFTAEEWRAMSDVEKQKTLMNYRIAYLGETMVNWCPGLGTVLANDEVVNGVSERGGYPVVQKKMQQWCLRTSAYSQRLLDGLDTIQWSDSIKETQKNWIGRSEGTEMQFKVAGQDFDFTIFTTRADTIFGVTFMVLAPESELVEKLTTAEQKAAVDEYLAYVKKRTELDRMANHSVTGVFSGSYAVNPFTGENIPIWISEYVLAGYGTGAIMAVPAHDSRDYAFAKHFNLPIIPLIEGADVSEESFDAKEGIVTNSPVAGKSSMDGFSLNGLTVKEAIAATKKFVTEKGIGRVKVNYRLRDAIFSRQRYWGEPFPVYYKDGMPQMVPEECLPLELPEIETYKPTETGEPPLGRAKKWAWDAEKKEVVDKSLVDNKTVFPLELNTMPGFAGSSAYYLRYMDPHNDEALVGKKADEYWQNVDLYVGGCEHATGHLIYSRFWNKFLFDLGVSCKEEPFQKLVNQGMIQGRSNFVYRINSDDHDKAPVFVSLNLKKDYDVTPIHVDVNIVSNDVLDIEAFKAWRPEYQNAEFILEDGKYICGWAIEKMSKSMFNVVNPDMIVEKYGADTLRLYEMFLGPVEASKPWDTNGIDGCHRFLKKFWGLFYENRTDNFLPSADEAAKPESLKSVHKLIKKVSEDIEKFSYNTSISAFMIAVNELGQQKCHNKELLTDLVILIAPFAPHIAEELWAALGEQGSVCDAAWPKYDEQYLKENDMQLTISFNGKARFQMTFPVDTPNEEIQKQVLADEKSQKYLEGFNVLKVIIVPKKIVNVVLKK